jgi:uncharacterized glyoxalase superfamily protein PhnB
VIGSRARAWKTLSVVSFLGQPTVQVQLSVRRGRAAIELYALGAEAIHRCGSTQSHENGACEVSTGRAVLWVEHEPPRHGDLSPETLGVRFERLLRRRPLWSSRGSRRLARILAARPERGRNVKINRSVPPPTVVPVLVYPDVRAAVAFLTGAFGFVERTRIGENHRAQLAVGADGAVIVADVGKDGHPPQVGEVSYAIRVRVADVDAAFGRARDFGAVVVEAPVDREYGEKDCTLEDHAGHRWQLAETVSDVAPEEFGQQTVSPWPAYDTGAS